METYKSRLEAAKQRIRRDMAQEITSEFKSIAEAHGFTTPRTELNLDYEQIVVDFLADPIDGVAETFSIICDEETTRFDAYFGESVNGEPSEPIKEMYGAPVLTWKVLIKRVPRFLDKLTITCQTCEGDGQIYENEDSDETVECPRCHGAGEILRSQRRQAA